MQKNYYIAEPLARQPQFSFVAVFRESTEYVRNYTLPFNMLGFTSRAEGADSSVVRNLRTGEVCHANLNDVRLIPCGLAQQYRHTLRNEHLCIHFKLELYPGVDVFAGQTHCFAWNSPEWTREAAEIFALPDPVLKLMRCQELALRICRLCWPEKYPVDMARMQMFDGVLQYIRDHADARTGVAELAERARRDLRNFTADFRAQFGISPKQFLMRELYRKAAVLLMTPENSVKQTAELLHFSTEFNFSRFFKHQSGISPDEYRKSMTHGLEKTCSEIHLHQEKPGL